MFIIDNSTGTILDISNNITQDGVYVKVHTSEGVTNYMAGGLVIINQDTPDNVVPMQYKYLNGEFVIDPDYVAPPISDIPEPTQPVVDPPTPLTPSEYNILSQEDATLKLRLAQNERVTSDNALSNQELLEALIDKGVL